MMVGTNLLPEFDSGELAKVSLLSTPDLSSLLGVFWGMMGFKVVGAEAFSAHQTGSVVMESVASRGGAVTVTAKLSSGKIMASESSSRVKIGKISGSGVGITVTGVWTGRQWY